MHLLKQYSPRFSSSSHFAWCVWQRGPLHSFVLSYACASPCHTSLLPHPNMCWGVGKHGFLTKQAVSKALQSLTCCMSWEYNMSPQKHWYFVSYINNIKHPEVLILSSSPSNMVINLCINCIFHFRPCTSEMGHIQSYRSTSFQFLHLLQVPPFPLTHAQDFYQQFLCAWEGTQASCDNINLSIPDYQTEL